MLLTPCYRSLSEYIGSFLDHYARASAVGWGCCRFRTFLKRLRTSGLSEIASVNNDRLSPEVDLSYSKNDEFKHVHLSLYNTGNHKYVNHQFNVAQLGMRWRMAGSQRPTQGTEL